MYSLLHEISCGRSVAIITHEMTRILVMFRPRCLKHATRHGWHHNIRPFPARRSLLPQSVTCPHSSPVLPSVASSMRRRIIHHPFPSSIMIIHHPFPNLTPHLNPSHPNLNPNHPELESESSRTRARMGRAGTRTGRTPAPRRPGRPLLSTSPCAPTRTPRASFPPPHPPPPAAAAAADPPGGSRPAGPESGGRTRAARGPPTAERAHGRASGGGRRAGRWATTPLPCDDPLPLTRSANMEDINPPGRLGWASQLRAQGATRGF